MVRSNSDRTLRKNEAGYASVAANPMRLSPDVESKPDDCRPGAVRGDHPGAFGGGAAI